MEVAMNNCYFYAFLLRNPIQAGKEVIEVQ